MGGLFGRGGPDIWTLPMSPIKNPTEQAQIPKNDRINEWINTGWILHLTILFSKWVTVGYAKRKILLTSLRGALVFSMAWEQMGDFKTIIPPEWGSLCSYRVQKREEKEEKGKNDGGKWSRSYEQDERKKENYVKERKSCQKRGRSGCRYGDIGVWRWRLYVSDLI